MLNDQHKDFIVPKLRGVEETKIKQSIFLMNIMIHLIQFE